MGEDPTTASAPAPRGGRLVAQPKAAVVDPNAVQLKGRITRILFTDAATGRSMMLVQLDGGGAPIKLQGALTFDAEVGKRLSALAVPEEHPKYGTQYKSDLIIEEVPTDRFGAVQYMARVLKGVSKATAGKIYDAFGEGCFDILTHEPRRLLGIGGINDEQLPGIIATWTEDSAVRNIWSFLGKHGINGAVAARIYAKFGTRSLQVAKERPYELTSVEGVGFAVADRIAAETGAGSDSAARIAGAVEYALDYGSQQGHTAKPLDYLVGEVQELCALESESDAALIERVIATQVARGKLAARMLGGKTCVTHADTADAEKAIAARIFALSNGCKADPALAAQARAKAVSLKDDVQAQAVANVFESAVSVITGRPGCGKTTVVKVINEVAQAAGLRVVMAAPTGKAARRMNEATGEDASTVHSLLKPQQGNLDAFTHCAEDPLEGDIFVLDESSMQDTDISDSFFDAVPAGARVVLVGDSDQLPSVGAGNVLHDIIASGMVPTTRLQKIHRTAMDSDIVVNAHKVIEGDANGVDLKGQKDFTFTQAMSDQAILDEALRHYLDMVGKYGVDSVQLLSARRGTATGVEALNALIRPVINPPAPNKPELEHRGKLFRLGDRVMRMKNNKNLGVSNGEVGIISHIDPDTKKVRVNFGDRQVVHEGRELLALDLAYATTIHKSQGSEYDGVIIVTPAAHQRMLNRNLVYTAMTRGKKHTKVIGDAGVLRQAIRKAGSKRCTGLTEELVAAFGGPSTVAKLTAIALPAATPPASPPAQATLLAEDAGSRLSARSSLFKRRSP